MKNKWLLMAAMSGFFCVAFGAFAAHALEKTASPQALIWIDKGLKYQMFHTLALLGLGLFQFADFTHKSQKGFIRSDEPLAKPTFKMHSAFCSQNLPPCRAKAFNLIGGSWALGIVLFSGSLYALALGASKLFVWTTPIGGTLFLVGWAVLIWVSLRAKK